MEEDPFDSLLELEEKFYDEGHSLGVEDGRRAGLVEGRLFGLEKGFEKYAAMGKLHGRSVVWAGRLPPSVQDSQVGGFPKQKAFDSEKQDQASRPLQSDVVQDVKGGACTPQVEDQGDQVSGLPLLPSNPRLEKHIRTLYALVEPSSLSTANSEDAVSGFDDRLKRAEGKVRIIEKLVGEKNQGGTIDGSDVSGHGNRKARDGGIEDINVLQARH